LRARGACAGNAQQFEDIYPNGVLLCAAVVLSLIQSNVNVWWALQLFDDFACDEWMLDLARVLSEQGTGFPQEEKAHLCIDIYLNTDDRDDPKSIDLRRDFHFTEVQTDMTMGEFSAKAACMSYAAALLRHSMGKPELLRQCALLAKLITDSLERGAA